MVLVDVVLVSTQELITTAKGINLLNALSLQLGSGTAPAFSRSFNSAAAEAGTVITRALTVPALAYSLNIANANNMLNEVLARPTLAAMEGLPSEFFSGTNLSAAVVSDQCAGRHVGRAGGKTFRRQTRGHARVPAQRHGQDEGRGVTRVLERQHRQRRLRLSPRNLGNLGQCECRDAAGRHAGAQWTEREESSSSRTGVPGVQDVPLVQYLFSSKRSSDFRRSVLILLTPRAPVYTSKAETAAGGAATDSMKAVRERFGFGADSIERRVDPESPEDHRVVSRVPTRRRLAGTLGPPAQHERPPAPGTRLPLLLDPTRMSHDSGTDACLEGSARAPCFTPTLHESRHAAQIQTPYRRRQPAAGHLVLGAPCDADAKSIFRKIKNAAIVP